MPSDAESTPAREPFFLGAEGEEQFRLLSAALGLGSGFELFFLGTDSLLVLEEIGARLTEGTIPNLTPRALHLRNADEVAGLLGRLLDQPRGTPGRAAVFVTANDARDETRAAWARSLARLNELRNRLIQTCPDAFLFAGPMWLWRLAHDVAPDLWSVRSMVLVFPDPLPADLPRSTR